MRRGKADIQAWRSLTIQAVSLFVGSRLLYVLIGLSFSVLVHGLKSPGGTIHFNQPWHLLLFNLAYTTDSAFYHSIAVHGYRHIPFSTRAQYNWAFFPLYPYLTRWTRDLFGLRIVDAGWLWTQLSFMAFLLLLGRVVRARQGADTAFLAMALAAFSPLTPYFVAYRAGSLFLALSMAMFYFLERSDWAEAILAGALASLARPVGILLAVPYLVTVWFQVPQWPKRLQYGLAAIGFALGFLIVGWIDLEYTGNALAFLAIQKAWNRKIAIPFASILRWLGHPHITTQGGWAFPLLAVLASLLALWAVVYLARRGHDWWHFSSYILVTVLLANASNSFEGIPRFIAELPPIYIALALWANESRKRQFLVLILVATLFAAYAGLWALGVHAVQN